MKYMEGISLSGLATFLDKMQRVEGFIYFSRRRNIIWESEDTNKENTSQQHESIGTVTIVCEREHTNEENTKHKRDCNFEFLTLFYHLMSSYICNAPAFCFSINSLYFLKRCTLLTASNNESFSWIINRV